MASSSHSSKIILSLLISASLFSGCAPLGMAAGVGAAVGVSAAKEGGIQSSITDESIRIKISDLWFQKSVDIFRKLNLTVNQGRVLVTGVVQKPEDRVEAIRLAWQPKGVKQVINEVRVGDTAGLDSYAQDTWISGQLRTRITFEKYVQSINYAIETVQGTVYLMGVAHDQSELDTVVGIAKRIKGVKEVISYVKLVGQPVMPENTGVPMAPELRSTKNPAVSSSTLNSATSTNKPTPLTYDSMPSDSSYTPEMPQQSGTSPSGIQSEVLPP